jgi:hypothetical protein
VQPHSSEAATGVGPSELEQVLRILFRAQVVQSVGHSDRGGALLFAPPARFAGFGLRQEPLRDEATLYDDRRDWYFVIAIGDG